MAGDKGEGKEISPVRKMSVLPVTLQSLCKKYKGTARGWSERSGSKSKTFD
jgi:hypothetical protein